MTGTPRVWAIATTCSSESTPGGLVNGEIRWATAAVRSPIASSSSNGCGRRARPSFRGAPQYSCWSERGGAAVAAGGRASAPGLRPFASGKVSRSQSSFRDAPKTAIQPVWQPGNTLLAGRGTNTWSLCELTATECAVPRGGGDVGFGVLKVGTI